VAAEYEVNIKINTQQIERELNKIDKTVSKIGKPKGGSKKSGVLMDDAELKRLQRAGIYLGQAVQRTDTLARAQDKRARLMNRINELESKGVSVSRLRQQMGKATKQLADKNFGLLEKEFRLLTRSVRLEESKLRIKRNQAAADRDRAKFLAGADVGRGQFGPAAPAFQGPRQMIASPVGGATNIPGSPAFLRRQQRIKTLEQVGLGAGFPLLFGGGAGSVLGGGLGGLTGSFGAQIAFSAIGQQIDQFIASVANVGTALTSASGTVEMFREKNLFSSEAVKKHAFELEQQGEMQQLATLLTKDLASQIGINAVKNFQELGGELKEFLGTINQLFLAVQGFVAGPLAKLLGAINTVLGGVSTDMQFANLRGSLTGDAAAQFEAIVAETRGTRALTGPERQRALRQGAPLTKEGRLTTTVKEAVLKDPRVAKLRQTLDVTGQTTTEDTLGGSAVKAAQRLLESSQRRIQLLKLETEEIKKATGFQDKIAAAQLLGDERTVARLTKERELSKIKLQQDKAIARINKKLPEAQQALERQAIEAKALAQAAEVRANFEREIASIVKDEQNEAYKRQAEILKKNFELQQQELKKAQDLAKGFADTVKDGFVDGIRAATDETRSLSDALSNMLNRLSDQLLNIAANVAFYGNAQGTLSQGQGIVGTILGSLASVFNPFGSLMAPGGRYEGMPQGQLPKNPPPLPPIPKALGGAVGAGRPYMVGERGPELFVPGAQGNIVPNNAMGSTSVVVNVDASGTEVQGNQGNADQLGRLIGQAVQAELIKQKRPGGLLTR
jgi:Mg2+ and Co2+ transporter CorA